jgi:hypothetical protein
LHTVVISMSEGRIYYIKYFGIHLTYYDGRRKIAKLAACAILSFNFNFNRFEKVFLFICFFFYFA